MAFKILQLNFSLSFPLPLSPSIPSFLPSSLSLSLAITCTRDNKISIDAQIPGALAQMPRVRRTLPRLAVKSASDRGHLSTA